MSGRIKNLITANNIINLTEATSSKKTIKSKSRIDFNSFIDEVAFSCPYPHVLSKKQRDKYYVWYEFAVTYPNNQMVVKNNACRNFIEDNRVKKLFEKALGWFDVYLGQPAHKRRSPGFLEYIFDVPGMPSIMLTITQGGSVSISTYFLDQFLESYTNGEFLQFPKDLGRLFGEVGSLAGDFMNEQPDSKQNKGITNKVAGRISKSSGLSVTTEVLQTSVVFTSFINIGSDKPTKESEGFLDSLFDYLEDKQHILLTSLVRLGCEETHSATLKQRGSTYSITSTQGKDGFFITITVSRYYRGVSSSTSGFVVVSAKCHTLSFLSQMTDDQLGEYIDAVSDTFLSYSNLIKKFIDSSKEEVW